jgi:hypothetical protein
MPDTTEFIIKDCALVTLATGVRAQSLPALREGLLGVPADSVYHHFWGGLLGTRFDDLPLAERLAVIDPAQFADAEALRQEVLEVVEQRLDELDVPLWAPRDRQFSFVRGQMVVFDTGRRLREARELAQVLPQLSPGSVFYHVIDARSRAPQCCDDFSAWLRELADGHDTLLARLADIDPYFVTLAELRQQYADVVTSHFAGVPA